ncbi:hypothetical protein [uncultured Microbacterium sp.]|uniref:hypothetical protein n=1 Tax=uncultured Microbacterium sp. TaxID=191216 RepID=UPI0025FF50E6|nr:hypothetical protein [uncultured Microbacterium sp.]
MTDALDIPRARRMIFTRDELENREVAPSELRAAGADEGGRWLRIQPGAYVDRAAFDALRPVDRHLIGVVAAIGRSRGSAGVVSHLSASVLHGLPQYRFRPRPISMTVPDATHPPSRAGLRRHTDELSDQDVVEIHGIRCTSLERTIFDVARTEPFETSVPCADAALRRDVVRGREFDADAQGVWREALSRRAERARGRRGVRRASWVGAFADGRAELPGESVSRLQLHRLGFRDFDLQVAVEGPRGRDYFVDIGLPGAKTFWEFDGEGKYRDEALRNGRSLEDVLLAEKRREDWIRGRTRWGLCRGGFADIASPERLAARLAAFGVQPPR